MDDLTIGHPRATIESHQGVVEDYYNSKRREHKNFKENLASFWDNLVVECQNGPLFDQILFEKCMDYVISLSCTPPRIYRQVASLVGLQLVTSFISVAKILGGQRETTQRQLNAEKKKRNDGPRVELLNRRLTKTHEKITVMEEMMRKMFTGAGVRKASVLALQSLYEVDDNVPSLGLFTERFCNRMIELADDIDVSVAVSAIGLLKQLLRHQLLADDELGPLYDLLIDEPPLIRRAIGELVYDHLIAQKFSSSSSGARGEDNVSSEVHLGRMLQILREFSTDPILSAYVIDDVWDDMKAMKDWKRIISMLLDDTPAIELTDVDTTNLVRLLYSSIKKAVGEKIVPSTDNRKQHYNKSQKDALENSRREITNALMKSYPQLLRKFLADKAKISPLVEIILHLKLELYSMKRQEQLIKDAFFKHGDKDSLRSCVKAMKFCSTESKGELRDFAQNKLKELENELIVKLRFAMKDAVVGDDEYSLLVNLKRLFELQLEKSVLNESLYEDLVSTLQNLKNADDEVVAFLLLNMYLHVAWGLKSVDDENPSEASLSSLLSKRTTLFETLEYFLNTLLEAEGDSKLYTHSISELKSIYETEDEDVNEEYIEETNRDTVMIAAAKLVASDTVPKATTTLQAAHPAPVNAIDYLGPEIISHFVMHGSSVAEIVKHLISALKKTASDDLPDLFLEALKRVYQRNVIEPSRSTEESFSGNSLKECTDLATRLSATFVGAARNKHRSDVLKICKNGISYAFEDAPKQLAFLEGAVLQFLSKLPAADVLDILKDVEKRSENINTDEDPSGWRPYYTFIDHLREKYAKNEGLQDVNLIAPFVDEKERNTTKRRPRGRPRKVRNVRGKKLFDEEESSEEEPSISVSEQEQQDEGEEEDEEEEELPLIHSIRASSKLRSLRVSQSERKVSSRTADSVKASHVDNNA
ncbi:hypothetical protein ACLOJK_018064 [Asimina triloba]